MGGDGPRFPRDALRFPIGPEVVASCIDPARPDDALFALAHRDGLRSIPVEDRRGRFCITVGEVAEAALTIFLVELGFDLVGEVGGRGRHGIDLLLLDPSGERLVAVEVKGTLHPTRWPRLRRGRVPQMSPDWLDRVDNPGMAEWDLRSGDIYGAIALVNLARGELKIGFTADFDRFAPVTDLAQLVDLSWLGGVTEERPVLEPGVHPPQAGPFTYRHSGNTVHADPSTTGDPFAGGTASWDDPLVANVLRLAADNAAIGDEVRRLLPWALTAVDSSSLGLVAPAQYSGPGATGLTGNLGHRTRGEAFAAELVVAACLASRSWPSTDGTIALGPTREAARVDFGIKVAGTGGGRRTVEGDLLLVDGDGRRRAIDVKHSAGAYRAAPGRAVLEVIADAIDRGEIDSFHYVATHRFRPAVLAEIDAAPGVFAHEGVWPTADMLASIDLQRRQRLDTGTLIRTLAAAGAVDPASAVDLLTARATGAYEDAFGERDGIVRIDLDGSTTGYLFDSTQPADADHEPWPRVLAAWTTTAGARQQRDASYVRRFPLPSSDGELDRGHLIAWSAGGADHLGINLIPQDRSLNQGRSAAGKGWRRMESAAAATPGTFIWVRAVYDDLTDVPCTLERLQFAPDGTPTFARFPNRPDVP